MSRPGLTTSASSFVGQWGAGGNCAPIGHRLMKRTGGKACSKTVKEKEKDFKCKGCGGKGKEMFVMMERRIWEC